MNFQKRPSSPLLTVLSVFVVLAAACGGDASSTNDDDASSSSSSGDVSEAVATEPTEEATAAEDAEDAEDADDAEEAVAGDGSTTGDTADGYLGSYELVDDEFGTMVAVTVADGTRTIVSNALPNHETGEFPNDGNPNEITAQDLTWAFPTDQTFVGSSIEARTVGVALNGVKFEPGTGETVTCDSGEQYRIEALQETYNLGLDFNNAHVQPGGEYHYHGISQMLVGAYESTDDLVHVGFAADGFLMFYSKSGAYTPSYELREGTRSGTGCVATGPNDPSVEIDGTTPDGVYASDWVFTEGAGDLDACNGITVDGQYLYVITDAYPFVSRCLNGEFAGDQPGGGAPGGGAGGGAPTPPDIGAIAADLGIDEQTLADALGDPPFDLGAAAETLGIPVEDLEAVFPARPGD